MGEWIPKEQFVKTDYGRLNEQPGAINYIGPLRPEFVPPGGKVVADPKDGRFGIVVDSSGTAVCKVDLPQYGM
jgi:hypothetical protein